MTCEFVEQDPAARGARCRTAFHRPRYRARIEFGTLSIGGNHGPVEGQARPRSRRHRRVRAGQRHAGRLHGGHRGGGHAGQERSGSRECRGAEEPPVRSHHEADPLPDVLGAALRESVEGRRRQRRQDRAGPHQGQDPGGRAVEPAEPRTGRQPIRSLHEPGHERERPQRRRHRDHRPERSVQARVRDVGTRGRVQVREVERDRRDRATRGCRGGGRAQAVRRDRRCLTGRYTRCGWRAGVRASGPQRRRSLRVATASDRCPAEHARVRAERRRDHGQVPQGWKG